MNMCWKCTHPQAIWDLNEFISSLEHIWKNVALHHFLRESSAVNGCRQNEVQTADDNITIIHK